MRGYCFEHVVRLRCAMVRIYARSLNLTVKSDRGAPHLVGARRRRQSRSGVVEGFTMPCKTAAADLIYRRRNAIEGVSLGSSTAHGLCCGRERPGARKGGDRFKISLS